MKPTTILFVGPQGSGKGTQVSAISDWLTTSYPELPVVDIQTGKPFRELANKGSYTATVVKNLIEHGKLVPTVLTSAMVMQEFISNMQENAVVLLDGYPRDLQQATVLEEMLTVYNRPDMLVVFLDTPDEVVKKRMLSRGRNDDTDVAIAERLRLYHEVTEPLIAYYQNRPATKVLRVDGSQALGTVTEAIKDALLGSN